MLLKMENRLKTFLERQRGETEVEVHARAHSSGDNDGIVVVGITILGVLVIAVVSFLFYKLGS